MALELRLPNINASTQSEKLAQMQSYMYQLVQELNWALSTVDSAVNGQNTDKVEYKSNASVSQEDAISTFNSIKALIIKSADIVQAYYDQMKISFDGIYTASSDFGEYAEMTNQTLELNSQQIQQNYYDLQVITGELNEILESQGWIRSGLLDYDSQGYPIYGVEVGQKNIVGGVATFDKYARFVADGIYFYLPGVSDPIGYFSGNKLFVTNAEISGSLKLGKYLCDTSNGLAIKWIG